MIRKVQKTIEYDQRVCDICGQSDGFIDAFIWIELKFEAHAACNNPKKLAEIIREALDHRINAMHA